jgi:hypothetical protein
MFDRLFKKKSVEVSALVVNKNEGITNIMQVTEETLIDLISDLKNPPEDNLEFIQMFENAMLSFEEIAGCTFTGRAEYLRLVRKNYSTYLSSLFNHFRYSIEILDPNNPINESKVVVSSNVKNDNLKISRVNISGNQYSFFNITCAGFSEIEIEEIEKGHLSNFVSIEIQGRDRGNEYAQLWMAIFKIYDKTRETAIDYANKINIVAAWNEGRNQDDDY